ncbi:hypothetical protein [Aquimarina algicola]|uniref:Uncharacterized protein n=1 Tax=Aquimarina algicola TaxID=2589995 RepID=A0A504J4Q5_9FLAO|nr:hypothetical protein [Aquimarina algicola]TPN82878.1 hypothetical protein FHK87_20850 [Aquimarina algicola]
MEFPKIIFIIIVLIITGYIIWNIKIYKRKKNSKGLIRNMILSILIVGFSWIWFVPVYVGQWGESPVCKFRFQVFVYETHSYSGYGDIQDILIKTRPRKYGMRDFYKKIGGWKEYFGLQKSDYQTYEEYFGKETE